MFVAIVEEVLVADHHAEAVESLAQELRILAALRHAPGDELLAIVRRRRHIEREGCRHIGQRQARGERACNQTGGAGKKLTSVHQWPPQTACAGSNSRWPDILNRKKTRHPDAQNSAQMTRY